MITSRGGGYLQRFFHRKLSSQKYLYLQSALESSLSSILLIVDEVLEPSIPRIVREVAHPDYIELEGWTLFFNERCTRIWRVTEDLRLHISDIEYVLNQLEGLLSTMQGTWVLLDKYFTAYTEHRYLERMENYNRMVAFYSAIWTTLNTVYSDLPADVQRIVGRAQGQKIEYT